MSLPFVPSIVAITDRVLPRYHIAPQQIPEDPTDYKSVFGYPVYSPLEFLEDPVATGTVAGQVQFSKEKKVKLRVDTAIITVTQSKTIVRTPIQGRPGTIKEYISDGDLQIDIDGAIISNYPNVFPQEDFQKFLDLIQIGKQIGIACEFLNLCGCSSLVIESVKISQKLGSRNEVPFTLSAWSDIPIESLDNNDDFIQ